ncbi:hypothetical protein NPIL_373051 [Nephila pilipes]|uniref:Uncharacterized protein n=1 Tax=Nephila pilipes TaxID=299642 RepID=A0A8X6MTL5_NEPPI|nr:hypothetical protein NPIL_373051 [Nephila pilipes]
MLEKSLTSLYESKLISKSPKTNRWNSITYPIKQASQPSKGEKVAVVYGTRYGEKNPAVRRKPVSREERDSTELYHASWKTQQINELMKESAGT